MLNDGMIQFCELNHKLYAAGLVTPPYDAEGSVPAVGAGFPGPGADVVIRPYRKLIVYFNSEN